jgi:hypothetical protein
LNSNPDRSLLDLFQANPSSYSSSFTPSPWLVIQIEESMRTRTSPSQWRITFQCQSPVVLSVGSSLRPSTR